MNPRGSCHGNPRGCRAFWWKKEKLVEQSKGKEMDSFKFGRSAVGDGGVLVTGTTGYHTRPGKNTANWQLGELGIHPYPKPSCRHAPFTSILSYPWRGSRPVLPPASCHCYFYLFILPFTWLPSVCFAFFELTFDGNLIFCFCLSISLSSTPSSSCLHPPPVFLEMSSTKGKATVLTEAIYELFSGVWVMRKRGLMTLTDKIAELCCLRWKNLKEPGGCLTIEVLIRKFGTNMMYHRMKINLTSRNNRKR